MLARSECSDTVWASDPRDGEAAPRGLRASREDRWFRKAPGRLWSARECRIQAGDSGGADLRKLSEVQSGEWLVWNGRLAQLNTASKCPECGTPNMCKADEYAYIRWYSAHQRGVDVQDDDTMAVFPTRDEAVAYREWLWQRALQGE